MNTEAIWLFLTTQGADFGLKVIGALVAWAVGRWLIGLAQRLVAKALERGKRIDPTLSHYLVSILGVVLNIVLILRSWTCSVCAPPRSPRCSPVPGWRSAPHGAAC